MEPGVDGFEAVLIDVCVNLRRAYVAVAQQFLDNSQIRAAAQQMAGEAVPKYMRRNAFQKPAPPAVFFNEHPERHSLHWFAGVRKKQAITGSAVEGRAAFGQIP